MLWSLWWDLSLRITKTKASRGVRVEGECRNELEIEISLPDKMKPRTCQDFYR